MAIGDTVTADRFNNLQTRITRILGFGGGDFGYKQGYSESTGNYGPAETSSQVSTDPLSNRNIATAADINELYIDLYYFWLFLRAVYQDTFQPKQQMKKYHFCKIERCFVKALFQYIKNLKRIQLNDPF